MTADELNSLISRGDAHHLLDVRYRLDKPDGRGDYRDAHLPGAMYVDLDAELSRHGQPSEGRHPLPSFETLQAAARRWGLRQSVPVIVYDDYRSLSAARAWWLLSRSGVADVRILDGGLSAWREAGLPLETGEGTASPGDVVLHELKEDILTVDTGTGAAGVYCRSGLTAAQAVFAAERAGLTLRIYPGSWSEWSNTPGAQVATGASKSSSEIVAQ